MTLRVSLLFLIGLTLAAQQPYSAEKEAAIGASLATDARNSTTAIESTAVRDYVQRIGGRLAAQLSNPLSYTFSVIADDRGGSTHEPLSLPGGYIFVPARLILNARNDAEFAGMLAHAMAHVAEHHGVRQVTRGEVANAASIPLIFMGGWMSMGEGDESLIPMAFRSTQRRLEVEADVLAVKMTSGAGYDPEALVRYIGRTQPPDSRESRIAGMGNAIRDLPAKDYSVGSAEEFVRVQDEVRRAIR
jgi:predicted Zn-dependent protease